MFGKKKEQVSTRNDYYETTISELKEELESLRQTVAAFPGAKQHWESELQAVKAEHEIQINNLNQQLKDKENETNIRVQTSLAKIGANASFAPKQISAPSNNPTADNQILKTFESLSGHEKSEYHKKHAAEIDRAVKILESQSQ